MHFLCLIIGQIAFSQDSGFPAGLVSHGLAVFHHRGSALNGVVFVILVIIGVIAKANCRRDVRGNAVWKARAVFVGVGGKGRGIVYPHPVSAGFGIIDSAVNRNGMAVIADNNDQRIFVDVRETLGDSNRLVKLNGVPYRPLPIHRVKLLVNRRPFYHQEKPGLVF